MQTRCDTCCLGNSPVWIYYENGAGFSNSILMRTHRVVPFAGFQMCSNSFGSLRTWVLLFLHRHSHQVEAQMRKTISSLIYDQMAIRRTIVCGSYMNFVSKLHISSWEPSENVNISLKSRQLRIVLFWFFLRPFSHGCTAFKRTAVILSSFWRFFFVGGVLFPHVTADFVTQRTLWLYTSTGVILFDS